MPNAGRFGIAVAIAIGTFFGMMGEGAASCPASLAGFMETTPLDPFPFLHETFEWYNYFGVRWMEPGDTVTVDLAIVPMEGAWTVVGLDGLGGPTFFALNFDGTGGVQYLVPGEVIATYIPLDWNDVRATLRFATQDVVLELNGESFGPFPFGLESMNVWALRVNGGGSEDAASGWIDAIRVTSSAEGVLFEEDFDQGHTFELFQGRLNTAPPPREFERPPSCGESLDAGKAGPPSIAPILVIWGVGAIPLACTCDFWRYRPL